MMGINVGKSIENDLYLILYHAPNLLEVRYFDLVCNVNLLCRSLEYD